MGVGRGKDWGGSRICRWRGAATRLATLSARLSPLWDAHLYGCSPSEIVRLRWRACLPPCHEPNRPACRVQHEGTRGSRTPHLRTSTAFTRWISAGASKPTHHGRRVCAPGGHSLPDQSWARPSTFTAEDEKPGASFLRPHASAFVIPPLAGLSVPMWALTARHGGPQPPRHRDTTPHRRYAAGGRRIAGINYYSRRRHSCCRAVWTPWALRYYPLALLALDPALGGAVCAGVPTRCWRRRVGPARIPHRRHSRVSAAAVIRDMQARCVCGRRCLHIACCRHARQIADADATWKGSSSPTLPLDRSVRRRCSFIGGWRLAGTGNAVARGGAHAVPFP